MIGRYERVWEGRPCPLGVLILTVLIAGCGPQFGDVSGTVKFKGEPLKTGTISFYDQANKVQSSPIGPDGTYSVSKVQAGPVKIAVSVPLAITMGPPRGDAPMPARPWPGVPALPTKYQDPEQSGLTMEVKSGSQQFDVRLE
jgi:hypothetical protein